MISPGGLAAPEAPPDDSEAPFLGVARSVSGKLWLARGGEERRALALSQRYQLPEVIGRILAARGVELDDAPSFLDPTLRELLPDPAHLKDMDLAAERIASAIMQNERIAVFGDYDVDGATSSALLSRFIVSVGGRCRIYIPDRIREGYGPNAAALMELKNEGVSVVITVDCGTTAFEPLDVAAEAGLDVIVVDHHVGEAQLPKALAVINPNRLDEQSAHGQMAAVGVAFLLCVAVNRTLREAEWYRDREAPDLTQWLDLVALGTVCDVVPLTGVNRAFVRQGLKVLAGRRNAGLKALADVARIDEIPGAYHLGFVLGPRVNAGGRVGAADLGARLLSSDDPAAAADLARRLDGFNGERRTIEDAVLADALDAAEAAPADPVMMVDGEGWHPGVIGIVASRLKERFHRPVFVITWNGDDGTASGRSLRGIDMGAAVIAARQAGLLEKGGGHAMAAGFTVRRDRLEDLRAFMNERVGGNLEPSVLVPRVMIDGALSAAGANLQLIEELARVGPFGAGNPEPRFVIANARLTYSDVVGSDHVKCTLESPDGGRLSAIAFRVLETPLGEALLDRTGRPLHVVGRLRGNTWQGRTTAQLLIDDAAPAW